MLSSPARVVTRRQSAWARTASAAWETITAAGLTPERLFSFVVVDMFMAVMVRPGPVASMSFPARVPAAGVPASNGKANLARPAGLLVNRSPAGVALEIVAQCQDGGHGRRHSTGDNL